MTGTAYHHGNLRAALIETAMEMARETGPDGLAVRELARRVGVSHNAAYRHFADRDQLVTEVSNRAMDLLTEAMAREVTAVSEDLAPVDRARARLSATGRAYVAFALAEPGLFRLCFAGKAPVTDELGPPVDEGPYGQLNAVLDELVEVGYLDPARRPGSEVACWSAVHGFSELCLDGPLRMLPPELRDAVRERLLETIERGLGGDA